MYPPCREGSECPYLAECPDCEACSDHCDCCEHGTNIYEDCQICYERTIGEDDEQP